MSRWSISCCCMVKSSWLTHIDVLAPFICIVFASCVVAGSGVWLLERLYFLSRLFKDAELLDLSFSGCPLAASSRLTIFGNMLEA